MDPALAVALATQSVRNTILQRRPYSQGIGRVVMLAPNTMHVMEDPQHIID